MGLKTTGTIQVDNGVRILLCEDLGKYYQWFIKREMPWAKTQLPSYKSHVTLFNPTIHGEADLSLVADYDGKIVEVEYEIEMVQSRVNFWMPAKCLVYHEIKWLLGFTETRNWYGLHWTVANSKFNR